MEHPVPCSAERLAAAGTWVGVSIQNSFLIGLFNLGLLSCLTRNGFPPSTMPFITIPQDRQEKFGGIVALMQVGW